MGKSIIVLSVLSLLFGVVLNSLNSSSSIYGIIFGILILLHLILVWLVFSDTKKSGKPVWWAGLTFLFGGVVGIIYHYASEPEKESSKIPEKAKLIMHIFMSGVMVLLFGWFFFKAQNEGLTIDPFTIISGIFFLLGLWWLIRSIVLISKK